MAYVLRELGDWDEAAEAVPRARRGHRARPTTRSSPTASSARSSASAATRARPGRCCARCLATATRLDVVSMGVDSAAALGWIDAHAGDLTAAAEHCRGVLERWERSEDHHYAVWGLRAAAWVVRHARRPRARARECRGAVGDRRRHRPRRRARPRSRTRSARPRCARATPTPPPTSSAARSSCRPTSTCRSSARRSRCAPASRWPPRASASSALQRLEEAYRARPPARLASRWRPPRRPSSRGSASRSSAASAAAPPPQHEGAGLSRRELEVMRLVSRRAHEPRDRARAVPQPAHGRHARPQHPRQAELPHAHRGREPRGRARPAHSLAAPS